MISASASKAGGPEFISQPGQQKHVSANFVHPRCWKNSSGELCVRKRYWFILFRNDVDYKHYYLFTFFKYEREIPCVGSFNIVQVNKYTSLVWFLLYTLLSRCKSQFVLLTLINFDDVKFFYKILYLHFPSVQIQIVSLHVFDKCNSM